MIHSKMPSITREQSKITAAVGQRGFVCRFWRARDPMDAPIHVSQK